MDGELELRDEEGKMQDLEVQRSKKKEKHKNWSPWLGDDYSIPIFASAMGRGAQRDKEKNGRMVGRSKLERTNHIVHHLPRLPNTTQRHHHKIPIMVVK